MAAINVEDVEVEYRLMDNDEEHVNILGQSLNLEYNGRYIPGNIIHNQLNNYQNEYRELFYENDNEERSSFYQQKKIEILGDPNLQRDLNYNPYCYFKNIYGITYPNFAAAKLGRIKGDILYSKFISIPRVEQLNGGHSEEQIFQIVGDIIQGEKYKNAELIILDINSALSMCDNCIKQANEFIAENSNVRIRVSFNFRFFNSNDPNISRHEQIPLSDEIEGENNGFSADNIILSDGYTNFNGAVTETDNRFRQIQF